MNKRFWMLGTSALVACAGLASAAAAQEAKPAETAAVAIFLSGRMVKAGPN